MHPNELLLRLHITQTSTQFDVFSQEFEKLVLYGDRQTEKSLNTNE